MSDLKDPQPSAGRGPQPAPIPEPDRHQIDRLNTLYRILDSAPDGGGLKARLASGARRLLGRVLSRQQEFNAVLVDHINRNLLVATNAHEASIRTIEWVGMAVSRCDEVRRYTEALLARERRGERAVVALAAQHDELRAAVGVLQQAAQTLKREVARLSAAPPGSASTIAPEASAAMTGASSVPTNQFDDLDSHKYVEFENQFRGTPAEIRSRLASYLPIFSNGDAASVSQRTGDVLDVGCGRGEFLDLLREHGVAARGIDVNPAMIEVCRGRGLRAETGDALAYLRAQPDGSLGGLFAAQVVEHLEPRYLVGLLDAAFDKLRPGTPIVLETINPACWFAFFESYIRDLTHVRPVHPDTLKYLLIASGFQRVDIQYREPYPESDKLQALAADRRSSQGLDALVETLNANVEKLNRLLFTYLDYAAVGWRA